MRVLKFPHLNKQSSFQLHRILLHISLIFIPLYQRRVVISIRQCNYKRHRGAQVSSVDSFKVEIMRILFFAVQEGCGGISVNVDVDTAVRFDAEAASKIQFYDVTVKCEMETPCYWLLNFTI